MQVGGKFVANHRNLSPISDFLFWQEYSLLPSFMNRLKPIQNCSVWASLNTDLMCTGYVLIS